MFFDFNSGFNSTAEIDYKEMPIIGISANIINENSSLHFAYTQSIIESGAIPLIIPANCDKKSILSLINRVDALLFSGGDDIDGRYFGQENILGLTSLNAQRDYYEFMLLRAAYDHGVPIFGICRGCQVINVAFGGSIYQDLPTMYPSKLEKHSILENKELPVHDVKVVKESALHSILRKSVVGVNSRHHQSIDAVAPPLKVVARSNDGVVEAVEGYPNHKILAVQWHPENMATSGGSEEMRRLFKFFTSEATLYRSAKKIHRLNTSVDSHCDTPMLYKTSGFDFAARNSVAKVDVVKMNEGGLDLAITAVYLSQKSQKDIATDLAFSVLKRFKRDLAKIEDRLVVAKNIEEVLASKKAGLKSVMMAIENGIAIGGDISNVDLFHKEGIVYITLCHNGSNDICDSAKGEPIHGGVSEFGKRVIERMNELGVTVDISHSSEKSTEDALRLSKQPIIASHSSCKALCPHPRNLSDELIVAIAKKGGVVQVCGYGGFLISDGEASIINLIEHIEHIVALTGYNHVGIGSDFDGGGGIEGFDASNCFINVSVELLRRGHLGVNVAKIMGENILRVISQNMNSSKM